MTEAIIGNRVVKLHANLGAMVKMEQANKTIDREKEPLLHTVMCIYALILGADPKSDITPETIQDNCSPEEWHSLIEAYKKELQTWDDKFRAATPEASEDTQEGND